MMKKVISIFLLSAFILSGCIPQNSKPVQPSQLVFKHVWFDFGKVTVGDQLTHTFEFTVEGGPVKITNIFAGCGCTTAKLEKHEYVAGETGEIIARVDTSDFAGLIYKEITVSFESSELGEVDLALVANVSKK